ncbi:MAG TPA: LysR family transcriptional regulator [Herbaspirillum sp.]|jgi:DNA-binding transcriptional LysR family regulator
MDINLARTFLEVASSGSFILAAERMHLTQTAVSARIHTLEEQLGRRLFVRNKAGARLTAAGERFVRHATALVQIWERARQQVALPAGREDGVSVGGELSLWHPMLADWLLWMHRMSPEIALRAEVDNPTKLLDRVQDGSLDMAVIYNPPQRPGLVSELLLEEKLIMVTTDPDGAVDPDSYVYVGWGPTFAINHQAAHPGLNNPPLSISLGPLALTYLLSVGGSGYFRIGTAQPFITAGRLWRVKDAPEFAHSAYAVYATERDNATMDRVRAGLRAVAAGRDRPGLNITIDARPVPSDEPARS